MTAIDTIPKTAAAVIAELKKVLSDKKAENLSAIDLRKVNSYLDYFVISTGSSRLHCRALAKDVLEYLDSERIKYRGQCDMDSDWIIVDTGDIIVHIFTKDMREYYDLDGLWSDADKM